MPSLVVAHHGTVRLGVRKASVDIILLDFDAIADEFGSCTQCSVGIGDWGLGIGQDLAGVQFESSAVAPALAEALGAEEPVVVDVVSDLEPRAPEPWVPG